MEKALPFLWNLEKKMESGKFWNSKVKEHIMTKSTNDQVASNKSGWLFYLSVGFGGVAWAIIFLNFTHFFGTNFSVVFWFVPFSLLGTVTGLVDYHKRKNKPSAAIAVGINILSLMVLLLILILLARAGGDAFRQ